MKNQMISHLQIVQYLICFFVKLCLDEATDDPLRLVSLRAIGKKSIAT